MAISRFAAKLLPLPGVPRMRPLGLVCSCQLMVYYDMQCPYILQRVETLKEHCEEKAIPASFVQVATLEQAKALPCVFNNWAVFYGGKFQTVNQLDGGMLDKIMAREDA